LIRISLIAASEESTAEDNESIENKEDNISHKTCARCKKDFHTECFFAVNQSLNKKQPSNPIKNNVSNSTSKNKKLNSIANNNYNNNLQSKNICSFCEHTIKKEAESMKISDFFKPKKNQNLSSSACKGKGLKPKESETTEIEVAKASNSPENDIIMFDFEEKKNENVAHYPKFILWKQLPQTKIEFLKENLKNALIFKNIEFSDDLAFLDEECPEVMNNAKLEPGIQKMSSYNKGVFYKFKQRTRNGEYPGLEIIEDPIQVLKSYLNILIIFIINLI